MHAAVDRNEAIAAGEDGKESRRTLQRCKGREKGVPTTNFSDIEEEVNEEPIRLNMSDYYLKHQLKIVYRS